VGRRQRQVGIRDRTLGIFAEQVTTVAREVGTEGILGGQARVPNVAGTWKDLTDNVNFMASNLTTQVRGIAKVVTACKRHGKPVGRPGGTAEQIARYREQGFLLFQATTDIRLMEAGAKQFLSSIGR